MTTDLSAASSAPSPIGRRPRIVVFDSGIGGLSVLGEIVKSRGDLDIVYVADDAAFPYGAWEERALCAHVVDLAGRLIDTHRPDLFVVACNTASTLVLPSLRWAHALGFVGTVPAIKPAAAATRTGLVSVLATPGTVARDYTRRLIEAHAKGVEVTLVGSTELARLAEAHLSGEAVEDAAITAEIAPCFVERDGRRTDRVVLACTHYPFLVAHFRRLAPWPVEWIDPAPAIARRVASLLGAADPTVGTGEGRFLFTSGGRPNDRLATVLAGLGLTAGVFRETR
jgi:glutamate racemase